MAAWAVRDGERGGWRECGDLILMTGMWVKERQKAVQSKSSYTNAVSELRAPCSVLVFRAAFGALGAGKFRTKLKQRS